jgi:hypothetical protein
MFPKVIVTTGCSYGLFYESFRHKIENNKDVFPGLELLIDLHASSMGSTFQSLSIIECVDKLVNNGINPSDIYVLGEFSQMNRRDIIIANQFFVNEIDNTKLINNDDTIERSNGIDYPTITDFQITGKIHPLTEKLKIKKLHIDSFPKFDNYYIVNPQLTNLTEIPNKYLQPLFKNYSDKNFVNIENIPIDISSVETINRALSYFQNIMFVQEYLKLKNIKYKFCLMQNQFSLYDSLSFRQDDLKTFEKNGEHYLNQDYLNSNQIWDISKPIKIIKNLINWDNWWFYTNTNKNIIWGGIDEYAIDKFGKKAYSSISKSTSLFGQHPNRFVYDDLIKEELMPEYFDNYKKIV